ncbi:MAG: metallophosphoesterase [Desulfuromonadales bacterium]
MEVKKKGLITASLLAVVVMSGMLSGCGSDSTTTATPTTTFMYTSDAHYGIKRAAFSGLSSAQQVNGAMITEMNRLQSANVTLPSDGGINAGQTLSAVDFVVETGDAINRPDGTTTPSLYANGSVTWPQFQADYFTKLNLKNAANTKAPVWMTPGNHDVSAAIGYYKVPTDTTAYLDATSYVAIYNLMMSPATALTNAGFIGSTPDRVTAAASYASKRVVTSKVVNGVNFVFVGMWPDSISRPLIDSEIAKAPTLPVILFTHDQPTSEPKHFTNPLDATATAINTTNKFENLLSNPYANSELLAPALVTFGASTDVEQRGFVAWLKTHKNIVAYFHGNDNANEYYTYTGPDNDIRLNIFRVDSPMKGNFSATDPTKLSFQAVSIDTDAKKMTVREYRWNTKAWGNSITVSLLPRDI